MQHFVNEYEYTPDVLEESVGAWWDCMFKAGYRSMLVVFILIAALSIVMKRPVLLLVELAPLFIIVLFKLKKKKSIQIEKERVDTLFRNSALTYRVEVGEDITVISAKGNNHIETKNLIILFTKGSMTVTLDKKGFREGTKEAFMSFLTDKIK